MGRADIATLPEISPGVRLCLHPPAQEGSACDSDRENGHHLIALRALSRYGVITERSYLVTEYFQSEKRKTGDAFAS